MKRKTLNEMYRQALTVLFCMTAAIGMTANAFSTSGAFSEAINVGQNIITQLAEVAKTMLPLALVILIFAILFTHDQKMLMGELKLAAILCVAYILLRIIVSGKLMETFDNIGLSGMITVNGPPFA